MLEDGKEKETEGGLKGKKGGRRKKEIEKVKGQNGVVYLERRKRVKEMKVLGLLPGRKIFFEPCL